MLCWHCLEEVSEEDPSCPHCGVSFPSENDEPRWKLERNLLDWFPFVDMFAFCFFPSVVTLLLYAFMGYSLKISVKESPILLLAAFTIFASANHAVKRGILVGKISDIEREKRPTAFNIIINIQVLLSISLTLFSINELLK